MFLYDEEFYRDLGEMKTDEKVIMPWIMKWLSPESVVDFGCGEGLWLEEVLRQDSQVDVLGVDGDYVNLERLHFPREKFMAADLRKEIVLGRKFDLAVSTEVAEHLEEQFADVFVDNIVRAADQILFSAAVPGQGGTYHVNEQRQSYWIEKFERRGYYWDDSVRNFFWTEKEVNSWRRQNLLFFSKNATHIAPKKSLADVVHPEEKERIQKELRKRYEERIEHFIRHPEVYAKLDQMIAKLVTKDQKIVIYPYGRNGRLCEKILRVKYGVEHYLIADNKVRMEGKTILSVQELKELEGEIVIVDTCGNPFVHREILEQIQKYVNEEDLYSVFECVDGRYQ